MAQMTIPNDVLIQGTLVASTLVPSSGCISNVNIAANAAIAATKQQHQYPISYWQADGTDVAAAIVPIYIVRGATATVAEVEAQCVDSPAGGDKKFTVDLQKANAGTPSPATLLSAVIDYTNGTADCTVKTGTVASPTLAAGDMLLVVVAVSGSTGTQGQGLVVTVTLREDAE